MIKAVFPQNLFAGKGRLFILSIAVGVITAVAVVLLERLSHTCRALAVNLSQLGTWMQWVVPAFPAAAILLCVLFVRFILRREKYVKSLDSVIQSTTDGSGEVPFYHTFAHIFTSGITVGMGGSAGLEAPSALTGSAIGANIGKWLKLSRENRVLLLACGGAAGIAAVFDSPLAGTLFACEILLPAGSLPALAPLLMSSVSAALTASCLYRGPQFAQTAVCWKLVNVPYYLLLGLATGLFSAYVIKTTLLVAAQASKLSSAWTKWLLGALLLYLFFLLFPALTGEGYQYIVALADGAADKIPAGLPLNFLRYPAMLPLLLTLLFLLKPLVSALTLESGGDGGIFGPSLFCGAVLGYFLCKILTLCGVSGLLPGVFVCAGMGGVLAGVMHAPLTGIFLIAELTGGFQLLIPLMIVAGLSSFISKNLTRYNIYKSMIAQKGGNPEPKQEELILKSAKVKQIMQTNIVTFRQEQRLREILQVILEDKQSIYPVLDKDGSLSGIINERNVRPFVLKKQIHDLVLACDLMLPPEPILHPEDTLRNATLFFDRMNCSFLPVCEEGQLLGMLAREDILSYYRTKLNEKADLF